MTNKELKAEYISGKPYLWLASYINALIKTSSSNKQNQCPECKGTGIYVGLAVTEKCKACQ